MKICILDRLSYPQNAHNEIEPIGEGCQMTIQSYKVNEINKLRATDVDEVRKSTHTYI